MYFTAFIIFTANTNMYINENKIAINLEQNIFCQICKDAFACEFQYEQFDKSFQQKQNLLKTLQKIPLTFQSCFFSSLSFLCLLDLDGSDHRDYHKLSAFRKKELHA